MDTLLIAILSAVGFVVAYHTYGRWLARKVFGLNPDAVAPAVELEDGIDFVPTDRGVVFGHHFTSIAGTGPIVGPAIAVFWGWLPALLWVVFGSIFIGAVHDFGALVVSMRSRGQTLGEVAARLISPRARLLFLVILFCALTVVLGIFGLVIALIFAIYPQSVLSIWIEIPIAIAIGAWCRKRGRGLLVPSILALLALYGAVWVGVRFPIELNVLLDIPIDGRAATTFIGGLGNTVVVWTGILFVYCFVASVLPVTTLLQPRDYINSHQLFVALGLIGLGLVIAHPPLVAPAINSHAPGDAPAIFPFLFITIACGAISGFHCLVSSGTSSKQLKTETDAQFVGYGAMLLEGALAVVVILACCAGLGMGVTGEGGELLTGTAAWESYYGGAWSDLSLGRKVGAFIRGSANMVSAVGLPLELCVGIMCVMVASFAATTLDTATRLQRYVIQELGSALRIRPLTNKYAATSVAVLAGGALALTPGKFGPGSGGLILWPLFGATNQLLAGFAFLVIAFYLLRHKRPIAFLLIPLTLMVILPAWAMVTQIWAWAQDSNWLLVRVGVFFEGLQLAMLVIAARMWRSAKGVLPEALPPLTEAPAADLDGGCSC